MPEAELVTRIRIDAMDALLNQEKPVLFACIRDDIDFSGTLEELETVAIYAGPSLRVCIVPEDLLPVFERRYEVTGTPTFLLFQSGKLIDSLLGKSTVQGLMDFIMPCVHGISKETDRQMANPGDVPKREKSGSISSMPRTARRRGAL